MGWVNQTGEPQSRWDISTHMFIKHYGIVVDPISIASAEYNMLSIMYICFARTRNLRNLRIA